MWIHGYGQWSEQLSAGGTVPGDPGAAETGGYVWLSAGAGDGAGEPGKDHHPGGVAVSGAVQAGGPGADLGQAGAGGQADDAGILPPGTGGRGAAGSTAAGL